VKNVTEEAVLESPSLPAARQFVEETRALYASARDEDELWRGIAVSMQRLLADSDLKRAAQSWPLTVGGQSTAHNLLFYEDPDYGFVFNATVREANSISNIHDHGEVWTLYGLIDGHETMYRYAPADTVSAEGGPAKLQNVGQRSIGPGDIDIVPPGAIHREHGGPARSIAFIVRARRPGTFQQRQYDMATGTASVTSGPLQIVRRLG
jgi:predicted metal-dependent enzyme (double-stranded beta helix superfamily)